MKVTWIKASEVTDGEAHARIELARMLADVIALIDVLTELFMPFVTDGARPEPNGQRASLQALEAGLFGHVRSLRSALIDGRVQDVMSLARTIDEIRKRAVVYVDDEALADRMSDNEYISMRDLDDRFEAILVRSGDARSAEQRDRDKQLTDAQSWLIHGRHRGVQFQVLPTPEGAVILRGPRGLHLPDQGRGEALYVISVAADALRALMPTLLDGYAVDHGEWQRRYALFDEELTAAAQLFVIAAKLRERLGSRLARTLVTQRNVGVVDERSAPSQRRFPPPSWRYTTLSPSHRYQAAVFRMKGSINSESKLLVIGRAAVGRDRGSPSCPSSSGRISLRTSGGLKTRIR